ncbi:MAG TPA: hypothetical protein PKE65_03965 [Rhizobiaceae bacterium]|nr:hypothetical protein [Rhizobiaceae bacterium]
MRRTIISSVALLFVAMLHPAVAEPVSGAALKSLVNGKRVYLSTPFGGEFPLHYRSGGAVTGDGSRLGLAKYFAPRETGRWWVRGDQLCQQWPTWYKGKVTCFRIEKAGDNRIRWTRDDGYRGRARIEG